MLLGSWCIAVHLWASSRRVDQAIGVLGILSRFSWECFPPPVNRPLPGRFAAESLEPPLTLPRFLQVFGTMALQRGGNGQPHGCTYTDGFSAQRGFSGWLLCSTWKNLGFVFERNCYSKNHQRQGFTTQKEVNFWLKGLAHNRRVLSGSDVLKEIQKNTWKTIEKAKRKTSEKGPG